MTNGVDIQVCKTNKIIMSNDINEKIRQLYEQNFLVFFTFKSFPAFTYNEEGYETLFVCHAVYNTFYSD